MKALIFDFGNVVAFFDHRKACRQLASLAKNLVAEDAVYQAVFGTSLELNFDCGKIPAHEFIERLRMTLDLTASDETIVKAWCDIFWPNDEVVSLLPRLKKSSARLVLASNTNELHFQWALNQFAEPLACFEDFVLSYRIGSRKPALAFFRRCVEAARAAPDDCIYVDDRPDFVDVARSMGMTGFVYGAGVSLLQALSAAGVEVI
ncbi:MAG TPA: HAD family phosphatase [Thermoanaerobaculia bacterium]|nr:HAD family phosphatase [Thermoanaerobaculia bacterium]